MTETKPMDNLPKRLPRRRWAVCSAVVVGALALANCSTVDKTASEGGGGGAPGAGTIVSSSASDAAIKEMWGGKTLKVGFSPPILSEFYTQIEKSAFNRMKEYEDRFGVKWNWERQGALNDAHSGTETLGIVQGYIARKFNAVFVCSAANAATMQQLYAQGTKQGVHFYQFNSTEELANPSQANDPTGGLNTISNIGYDDRWQSGYLAGQYIAKQLKGKGTVIQILGPAGSDWTKLRQKGFETAIAEYPGLKIAAAADGGYVRDKGLAAAQDLLVKYPDVDAIYGENEDMALGASQAIDARGLKHWDGSSGIITIGADGLVSGMEAIKAGKLTATVNVNSIEMGRMMVDTLVAHEVLGEAVSQFVRIPTVVVDKSNVNWNESIIKEAMAAKAKY
jgi:ABC-type sugar transport system substrate-binding protein